MWTRDDVLRRVERMEKTPQMWALTVEGYVMQLALLGEFLGYDNKLFLKPLVHGSIYRGMQDELTNSVAAQLVDNFRKVVGL